MEEPVYTHRNPRPKARRPTKVTVPERVSPFVKLLFSEMQRRNVIYDEVEEGSGVRRAALKAWRHKNRPNLDSIEAALGFMGFEFVPLPQARVLPEAIVAELRPIATRLGIAMPEAVRLTAEIAYRDHHLAAITAPT